VKQVAHRLKDGKIEVLDVPAPELTDAGVLVDVRASLLSAGTERTKVETARKSLIGKARSRPDQVRKVIEKARRDGLVETVRAVRAHLDQPSSLGYSAAGIVLAVGPLVSDVAPGDRVAIGGGDYAVHADIDHVPVNLCVPIPAALGFDEAAFAAVGAIALHGVRQSDVTLGERVAVIGLGLVGQLAGQILRASGCTVVGVDLSADLVERALRTRAADVAYLRNALNGDRLPFDAGDCDAVIITAATSSDDPVALAAHLCRDRARVVIVGLVGMELPRAAYYDKELDIRLSRSYGPGRYDVEYEERGLDYPVGYVRWTERRNMQAFLELVASGRVDVSNLITERVPVEGAPAAYDRLLAAEHSALGIVLEYGPTPRTRRGGPTATTRAATGLATGLIGPGSFAQRILLPGLKDAGFDLRAVASGTGLSARSLGDTLGLDRVVAPDALLTDPELGVVVIATRHASHARLAAAALRAGKAVFVEKPPALTWEELADVRAARAETGAPLAVGFNRRHAPLARRLRDHVRAVNLPFELLYRVNAGRLDLGHWLNDVHEGGGRLLGEGCHFVDFACWVAGAAPARVSCLMAPEPSRPLAAAESFTVALEFAGGSIATILYSAGGSPRLPKERIEAHAGGRSAILDDFRSVRLFDDAGSDEIGAGGGDKGHRPQLAAFRLQIEGGPPVEPDPLDSMAATLAALESAQTGAVAFPGADGG
jgi:predicted dehydrogenase/threonine dehydrogenase-like Zn-dependent dehydrogenase